jgi:hypothetical protein
LCSGCCHRKRQTADGRWYGTSLLGVGAGSITYHCSRGRWRAAGRMVDYWAISAASAALVGGLIPTLVQALLCVRLCMALTSSLSRLQASAQAAGGGPSAMNGFSTGGQHARQRDGVSVHAQVRASRPGTPRAATALSLALTPFQPFAVVCVNGAVAEVRRGQLCCRASRVSDVDINSSAWPHLS